MESNGSMSTPQNGPKSQWSLSSSSALHYGSFENSLSSLTPQATEKPAVSPRRAYIAVAVLCYVNLINYMERYTIAVFICSFLLLAPVFGYLGDRYNRKYIMIGGLTVWIVTSFSSSFVTESYFWFLMLMRAMVGIGEASYTTIAPTIIGDLFTGAQRSTMICAFYILIPVGSGLGFITGSGIASVTGDWHWAFRINPIFTLVGLVLLALFCLDPPRGAAETLRERVMEQSTYLEDIKYLLKNKSYVWSTLGITASTFNLGALAFWMPTFLTRARAFHGLQSSCPEGPCHSTDSYIFGIVTIVTGILGGSIGTVLSRSFIVSFQVFISLSQLMAALNWAVMADILLYIVIPTRRSTAEALQITFIHLLGDCGSPYLVGISDAIYNSNPGAPGWSFHSLQYSFVLCPAVGFLGGLFYLVAVFYITEDRRAVLRFVEEPILTTTAGILLRL
uniref:Major facilitator superfamily (MFS) profile domain-containing protein n=1 Tax=Mola mola TaxID=94237 RepID=A0A3Q3W6P1_MOLML